MSTVSVQAQIKEKYQSSASLAFVRGIHRWPVISPHKRASSEENVSIWWRHYVNSHTWLMCNVQMLKNPVLLGISTLVILAFVRPTDFSRILDLMSICRWNAWLIMKWYLPFCAFCRACLPPMHDKYCLQNFKIPFILWVSFCHLHIFLLLGVEVAFECLKHWYDRLYVVFNFLVHKMDAR